MNSSSAASGKGATDENFPVASFLVPRRHREVIMAFYRFARAADDIADHPHLPAADRLGMLDRMEQSLTTSDEALVDSEAAPLRASLAQRGMTADHPIALLSAFRQDVTQQRYDSWAALMDYCARSAAPVGRFVLDVHAEDRGLWPASDALCAALQVINHIQDCRDDLLVLDRCYVPGEMMESAGATIDMVTANRLTPQLRACIDAMLDQTSALLDRSATFAIKVKSTGLALEVAVIHSLARRLLAMLRRQDMLATRVSMGKPVALGVALAAIPPAMFGRLGRFGRSAPYGT